MRQLNLSKLRSCQKLWIALLLPVLAVTAAGQERDARRRDRDREDRDRSSRESRDRESQSGDARRHAGYVDGSDFAKMAGEDADLIEVSIEGPLLKMVAKGLSDQQPELADIIGGIVSINAIVIDSPASDKDNGKAGDISRAARDLAESLRDKNWQQLARIREKGDANVIVLAHMEDEAIDGLVVLVVEGDEFVFVNIAGRIDIGKIAEVGMNLDMPGIQHISKQIMQSAPARTRGGRDRDDAGDDDRNDGRSDRGGR